MSILKRPILTEKANAIQSSGKYTFEVERNANKIQIAQAVENLYGVGVASVNTALCIGRKKTRVQRGRFATGQTSTYKKAVVTLKAGEVIDIYNDGI